MLEHTGLAQLQDNGLLISAADIAPRQAHLRMLAAARSSGRTRRLSITGAVWTAWIHRRRRNDVV